MKTWTEKLNCGKKPQLKKNDKPFAGIPKDSMMYISTPEEINSYIMNIPKGVTITPKQMREDLAKSNHTDYTCPVTTGIFLRIVAEAAYEKYSISKKTDEITPFWRVIEPNAKVAEKLACGIQFISKQRSLEEN